MLNERCTTIYDNALDIDNIETVGNIILPSYHRNSRMIYDIEYYTSLPKQVLTSNRFNNVNQISCKHFNVASVIRYRYQTFY